MRFQIVIGERSALLFGRLPDDVRDNPDERMQLRPAAFASYSAFVG